MDEDAAQRALRAYRQLVRIARHPEREPAWLQILADLADAEAFYRDIEPKSSSQYVTYQRILRALKR